MNLISGFIRLLDVLVLGPMRIYLSSFLPKQSIERYIVLLIGVMTIFYNLNNLLTVNLGYKNLFIPKIFVTKNGKTQTHRLYNVLIMYPFEIYVLYKFEKLIPNFLKTYFQITIVLGLLFNLRNYLFLRR